MRLENIRTRFSFDHVECETVSDKKVADSFTGVVRYTGMDKYLLAHRDNSIHFVITDKEYKREIDDLLHRRYLNVSIVQPTSEKGSLFTLQMLFFPNEMRFGEFQVIVSKPVIESLVNKHIIKTTKIDWDAIASNFCFDDGMRTCFLYTTGRKAEMDSEGTEAGIGKTRKQAAENETETEERKNKAAPEEEFAANDDSGDGTEKYDAAAKCDKNAKKSEEDENEGTEEETKANKEIAALEGKLRLIGEKYDFLVRLETTGEETKAVVYKAIFQKRNSQEMHQIGIGELSFSDEDSYVAASVRKILSETPNYLTSWDEYAKKEGEFLLAKAKSVGVIECNFSNIDKDGCFLFQVNNLQDDDERFDLLTADDYVQLVEEIPKYIESDMDWEGYKKCVKQEKETQEELKEANLAPKKEACLFQVKELPSKRKPFLKLEGNGKKDFGEMRFIYSIRGDEVQISRREEARERIMNGIAAMPNLGLILGTETDTAVEGVKRKEKVKEYEAISPLVREKFFKKNRATDRQEEAIKIALNTPDIAIIQGPPGTGKTTVITAILERLNEIADKRNFQAGRVLVTSLQHVAVDNVIERIHINSMPVVKFGKRGMDASESLHANVQKWCRDQAEELEKKHGFLQETKSMQMLSSLFNLYVTAPSKERAIAFLSKACVLADGSIAKEIDNIMGELKAENIPEDNDHILRMIFRLRVTPEGFQDDGARCAEQLCFELEELFGEKRAAWQRDAISLLHRAAVEPVDDSFLQEIGKLRKELLNRFIPRPVFEVAEPREDIIDIYHELRESSVHPVEALHETIYCLYNELQQQTPEIQRAVAAYTFAFAATAQQSDAAEIKRAKHVAHPREITSHASYDTVIVDEAARIAPGDIMIPLSQAERRIILVGDQKQLPHMFDEEIYEHLCEEGKIRSGEDIKISMFQHLWNTAKKLEARDHIKRTVTLDRQYRMHPMLGKFVSDNFYARDGQGFASPLGEANFAQPIRPGFACIWIDIPASKGKMKKRSSGTRIREVEAEYIRNKLKEYLQRTDCDDLEFGAISFYGGQSSIIADKIGADREGQIFDETGNVRGLVGTVDAFQGREFDVIFLSVVRSGMNPEPDDLKTLDSLKSLAHEDFERSSLGQELTTRYYGFLNDNRLCVALSRQKKLLIVVGDAKMFSGKMAPFAKRCVPAMYNLYSMCKNAGSVFDD